MAGIYRVPAAPLSSGKHARLAQQLAGERRGIIRVLIRDGFSRISRELGVTRQAVQKMLAL